MIACMIHLALWDLLGFNVFFDEEVGHLVEAVTKLFDLFIRKIPLAGVSFAFLNREHGNPLAR